VEISRVAKSFHWSTVNLLMSASDKSKPEPKNGGDSDYDSAEDDDFNGDDDFSNSSSDESNAPNRSKRKDKNLDSGDEATIETRKKRRKDDDGDLILTRAQRRAKYSSG